MNILCLYLVCPYCFRISSGGSKRTERGASGVSSRNSQQGVRRAVPGGSGVPRSGSPIGGPPFNNRSEKESAVNLVKQLSHPHEPEPAQLHRELTQQVNWKGETWFLHAIQTTSTCTALNFHLHQNIGYWDSLTSSPVIYIYYMFVYIVRYSAK